MIERGSRAAVATVVAEGFLGRLAFGMVSFALPLYAFRLGLNLSEIGLLISLRTVVALLAKPAAGWASDRFGVRAVYLAGSLARVLAVAGLLAADGYVALIGVRLLQGLSAAGRDVASLGVIAKEAETRVGSAYSWYTTAKHVGGVAGAAAAGLVLGATGGSFDTLFVVVLALSVLPMVAAWFGLRLVVDAALASEPETGGATSWVERVRGSLALLRELSAPASVALLAATSAYMVHGIFPILATEYAGLSEAETGVIYSLSAAVFLVAGPSFGWLVDHRGAKLAIAWRAAANIGSSVAYLVSPSFAGLAVARAIDDSGKAAFRPAWATTMADVAAADPPRRGRRLGLLDASQTTGEVIGPLLAGVLWQSGGVVLLFVVRIVIAAVAEAAALRAFAGGTGRPSRALSLRREAAASPRSSAG